ncbi:MAG: DMT family transporter [Burkholderiales bacterium]|nr:DMT family transporter [Burkholderiales bacterium]MDE2275585.1 DMT family transporter [Burkholderiales bacterium]
MTEQRKPALDSTAVLTLLACSAVWGLGQVAAKVGLREFPPLLQAAVRSLGAALLLLAWSRWRGLPILRADGTGGAGLLAGSLFAAEFACIFVGLQFTSASRMAVFIYLAPFVVAAGMPLIARSERLDALGVAGLLLAFGGVVWAFAEGFVRPAAGARQWLGDALGIGAALTWGLTTLTVRASRLATALPEKTLLYQLGVSAAALGLASLLRGEAWPPHPGLLPLAALAFQTVVITFASYLAWFWLVRHYPATRISVFALLTPVFGLGAGVLLLGEPLTTRLVAALAAVCAGILLVNRPPRVP